MFCYLLFICSDGIYPLQIIRLELEIELVITNGYGVRATTIAFAPSLCFAEVSRDRLIVKTLDQTTSETKSNRPVIKLRFVDSIYS